MSPAVSGILWAAGVTLLLALPACTERRAAAVSPQYHVDETIALPAISSDAFILGYLEAANWGDKEGGRLAEARASDPRVKAFGRYMADQHEILLRLTERTSASLRLPPAFNSESLEISTEQRQALQRLRRTAAPAFDRAYLRHEIETHREVVERLKQAIVEAHNPEVKQLVDDSQPVVQAHLDAALALDRALSESGRSE